MPHQCTNTCRSIRVCAHPKTWRLYIYPHTPSPSPPFLDDDDDNQKSDAMPYLMLEHHYRHTDHQSTTMALNVTPSVSPTAPEPGNPTAAAMDANAPNGIGMGTAANLKVSLAAAKAIPSTMINDCDNQAPIENFIVSPVRCDL